MEEVYPTEFLFEKKRTLNSIIKRRGFEPDNDIESQYKMITEDQSILEKSEFFNKNISRFFNGEYEKDKKKLYVKILVLDGKLIPSKTTINSLEPIVSMIEKNKHKQYIFITPDTLQDSLKNKFENYKQYITFLSFDDLTFDIFESSFVGEQFITKDKIENKKQLQTISDNDIVCKFLGAKNGDVIAIVRTDYYVIPDVYGEKKAYRLVIAS